MLIPFIILTSYPQRSEVASAPGAVQLAQRVATGSPDRTRFLTTSLKTRRSRAQAFLCRTGRESPQGKPFGRRWSGRTYFMSILITSGSPSGRRRQGSRRMRRYRIEPGHRPASPRHGLEHAPAPTAIAGARGTAQRLGEALTEPALLRRSAARAARAPRRSPSASARPLSWKLPSGRVSIPRRGPRRRSPRPGCGCRGACSGFPAGPPCWPDRRGCCRPAGRRRRCGRDRSCPSCMPIRGLSVSPGWVRANASIAATASIAASTA